MDNTTQVRICSSQLQVINTFMMRRAGHYWSNAMSLGSQDGVSLQLRHTGLNLDVHLVASFDPDGVLYAGFEGRPCAEIRLILNKLAQLSCAYLGGPNAGFSVRRTRRGNVGLYGKVPLDPHERVPLNIGRMAMIAINADREAKGLKPYVLGEYPQQ